MSAAASLLLPVCSLSAPCLLSVSCYYCCLCASVNLRWWLDKADLRHLRLYTVNGLLLLLVWGVARVVLFVPFYVHVLANWVSAAFGGHASWTRLQLYL